MGVPLAFGAHRLCAVCSQLHGSMMGLACEVWPPQLISHVCEIPTTLPSPPYARSTPDPVWGYSGALPSQPSAGREFLCHCSCSHRILRVLGVADSKGALRSSTMSHSFLPMFYSLKLQSSPSRQGLHSRNLTNNIVLPQMANCAKKQSHGPPFHWLPNSFWKLTPRAAVASPS